MRPSCPCMQCPAVGQSQLLISAATALGSFRWEWRNNISTKLPQVHALPACCPRIRGFVFGVTYASFLLCTVLNPVKEQLLLILPPSPGDTNVSLTDMAPRQWVCWLLEQNTKTDEAKPSWQLLCCCKWWAAWKWKVKTTHSRINWKKRLVCNLRFLCCHPQYN